MGFVPSRNGFFGPAVYFYEDTPHGWHLAKIWIGKKISWGQIANWACGRILLVRAECDNAYFVDATEDWLLELLNKAADRARNIAWSKVEGKFPDWPRELKKRYVDRRVNRARNSIIARAEEIYGTQFHMFKGQIEPGNDCFVVRQLACLAPPPYQIRFSENE